MTQNLALLANLTLWQDFGLAYHATTDRNLPTLGEADILWIGFRSLSEGRYRLNKKQENRIKEFVKNGGIVIASGQDSDDKRPCGSGWLPVPLAGVESSTRNDFQPTSHAGELFKTPNRIRSGQLALDDSWKGWNEKYKILADNQWWQRDRRRLSWNMVKGCIWSPTSTIREIRKSLRTVECLKIWYILL